MKDNQLQPRESLNKAFLKVKPDRENMEKFRANLSMLLDRINETESEEFHKNLVADFLKNTYYSPNYFINTKERNDLVIHNGKEAKSPVGVILEAKKPRNKAEMLKVSNLNTKAFQELVLYFLRERITKGNLEIRYLVATNVYEWFIFDAREFDKFFVGNKDLVKQFEDFEQRGLSITKTDAFYKEIAKPAIAAIEQEIKFTYFDLRDYREDLSSSAENASQKLVDLYKIFAPEHLLKLPFANDSNTLNKPFYNELLHIIGLTEIKVGGKKLIGRKQEGDRNSGSLIENAISRLDSWDKMAQLRQPEEFGETQEEKLFNVALRLSITWINRILFLKLLEAQLIKYHRGDQDFAFLNLAKVENYDDLDSLFFDVLACEQSKRDENLQEIFAKVPYLNSSLFEPTDIEQQTIFVSNLQDRNLPIFGASVLKDSQGKRRSGALNALAYLFEFLSAYNFSSDELESGEEDSEKLINAAVLGLIFEKINGYKDGSFYTPSFITMYMCRETIRRSVVQKFKEIKGWDCADIGDLYERITDKQEANKIINSLKICDPAVGSGHFLVSALNEIIVIKRELGVLLDRAGKSLRDYRVEVRNDKLLVYDDEGKLFAYNPKNEESQRVQETLFHEKQTIIESCLFGVDINPNSVTICRLRLWIELLKNAYYRVDPPQPPFKRGENLELETLPNIDINIKCGNSLISRFELGADLGQALKTRGHSIESYKAAVQTYRNAESKDQKREMERLIKEIKGNFRVTLQVGDRNKIKLRDLEAELINLESQIELFEKTKAQQKAHEKKVSKLQNEIDKLRAEIEDIESGRLYENALEWRFEFPEVLNDDGDFVGFDVVIGNPPYINAKELVEKQAYFREYMSHHSRYLTLYQKWDIYIPFIEQSINLTKQGLCSLIIPYPYLNQTYAKLSKEFLIKENTLLEIVDLSEVKVFEEAVINNCIIFFEKRKSELYKVKISRFTHQQIQESHHIDSENILGSNSVLELDKRERWRFDNTKFKYLGDLCFLSVGMVLNADEKKAKNLFVKDDLISNFKSETHSKKYIEGRSIDKYIINTIRFLEWNTDRVPCLIRRPTFQELYERQKIVINKIGTIKATYDNDHLFCDQTIRIAVLWVDLSDVQNRSINNSVIKFSNYTRKELEDFSKQMSLKFILAILNSNLANYLLDSIRGVGNIDLNPEYLKNIPIPYIKVEYQQPLIQLVDQLLDTKKSDRHADTSELEKEIDRLVYKLYQLTYEEIKIIDPEFALTEPEYTAIQME